MKTAGVFIILVIAYALVWFLGTTGLFIARAGNAPAMNMWTAIILGFFTAILHTVVGLLVH